MRVAAVLIALLALAGAAIWLFGARRRSRR